MNNTKILAIVALLGTNICTYGMTSPLRPFARASALFKRVLYGKPQFDMAKLQEEAAAQDEIWTHNVHEECLQKARTLRNILSAQRLAKTNTEPTEEQRTKFIRETLLSEAQRLSGIDLEANHLYKKRDQDSYRRKTLEHHFHNLVESGIGMLSDAGYGVKLYSADPNANKERVKEIIDNLTCPFRSHCAVNVTGQIPFGVLEKYGVTQYHLQEQQAWKNWLKTPDSQPFILSKNAPK